MLFHVFILFLISTASNSSGLQRPPYCLSHDETPYLYFSSKTSYKFASRSLIYKNKLSQGCKPTKLWLYSRHEARYPDADTIKDFLEKLPELKQKVLDNANNGLLCPEDLLVLEDWSLPPHLNVTWDSKLAEEGRQHAMNFGKRIRNSFRNFLPQKFSNQTFLFRQAGSERTLKTAEAFAEGLFGKEEAMNVFIPPALKKDLVLKFYDFCSKHKKEVVDNPKALEEYELFKIGSKMKKAIAKLSTRVGFDIDAESALIMYNSCRFEKAWTPLQTPPWCVVFTPRILKIIEYAYDLMYFYRDGYGHDINYLQACQPIRDFVKFFTNDDSERKAKFYFTHSAALNKVMARLGLFHDAYPLSHSEVYRKRVWRMSKMDPFGGNLLFVVSKCLRKEVVSLFVNEKLVRIPNCGKKRGRKLCNLKKFLKMFRINCDFDRICENY